LIWK